MQTDGQTAVGLCGYEAIPCQVARMFIVFVLVLVFYLPLHSVNTRNHNRKYIWVRRSRTEACYRHKATCHSFLTYAYCTIVLSYPQLLFVSIAYSSAHTASWPVILRASFNIEIFFQNYWSSDI
jgi:hypothetical protein